MKIVYGFVRPKVIYNIIKYNKKIKKHLKINLKSYQNYQYIYTQIEINIKPPENKIAGLININKSNKDLFIYIYILIIVKTN